MPLQARTTTVNNNLVRNLPALRYPMSKGKVSASASFEANPTASIEYTEVDSIAIASIEGAYRPGTKVSMYGINYVVVRFGYDRVRYPVAGLQFDLFNASISLEGVTEKNGRAKVAIIPPGATAAEQQELQDKSLLDQLQDKAALEGYIDYNQGNDPVVKQMDQGGSWSFSDIEVLTDGKNEIALNLDGYDRAELTWRQEDAVTPPQKGPKTIFTLKPPDVKELREFSKDYDSPPENTVVLRDLSNNFDESGEKKVNKVTRVVNGNPESEVITTYGFAYNKRNIVTNTGELFSNQPERFWIPVEYQKTDYIYRRAGSTTVKVRVEVPKEAFGIQYQQKEYVDLFIHPDYRGFVSEGISLGDQELTISSATEYLVEVVTTGWKLVRFIKETEGDEGTLDPENPYMPLLVFRRIPFYARTVYVLKTGRKSGDKIDPPFRVEWTDYDSLDPRLKQEVDSLSQVSSNRKVGVLYPDPNYSIPFLIFAQYDGANSFAFVRDPEGDEDEGGRVKRYTTGQETRNEVERTLIESDYYSERIMEYSSQDPGFDNSIEQISFRYTTGTIPNAQTRQREYESKEQPVGGGQPRQDRFRYWVTTSDNSEYLPKGGSVSVDQAKTLNEALKAISIQLRKASMQNSQCSKTIAWFYPMIRPGDYVNCGAERFRGSGRWRVMSTSWSLDYKGANNPLGLVVTTEGTQITVGLDRTRSVTFSKDKLPPELDSNTQDPNLIVTLEGEGFSLSGTVLPSLPNRRNF